ncbi:hypothetical protein Tco_0639994 [Tanacetum coccineum]
MACSPPTLSNYQTKLEKALIDFDSHQEKRLSILRTHVDKQQDDMISKINLLWKTVFLKGFDDTPIHEAKEEGNVKSSTTEYKDHEMTVESKEEFEEETEEEIEEERRAKIMTGNLNNVKFSCMIGHFDKKQAYLDMESPINVMSRLHYNWIMSKRLEPRRKPSNPKKICNFIGRVKGLKIFVGKCDFVVLEDTTSVMDHDLGSIVFRKPFVEATGLVYDKEEGTIAFEKDKEKIAFKCPTRWKCSNT